MTAQLASMLTLEPKLEPDSAASSSSWSRKKFEAASAKKLGLAWREVVKLVLTLRLAATLLMAWYMVALPVAAVAKFDLLAKILRLNLKTRPAFDD